MDSERLVMLGLFQFSSSVTFLTSEKKYFFEIIKRNKYQPF